MDELTFWIVAGSTGHWDGYYEWIVCICLDEESANARQLVCEAQAKEYAIWRMLHPVVPNREHDDEMDYIAKMFDKKFQYRDDRLTYYVYKEFEAPHLVTGQTAAASVVCPRCNAQPYRHCHLPEDKTAILPRQHHARYNEAKRRNRCIGVCGELIYGSNPMRWAPCGLSGCKGDDPKCNL